VSAPREIVVVELLGGFGDLLLVLPAVHALALAHPQAAIRVVTLAPGETLLTRDPAVRSVTVAQADDAAAGVSDHLDRHPADLAVSTTMHSGIAELLAARVPRAVTNLWRSPPPDELVDRRFLRLLADEGLIDPADVGTPLRVVLTGDERTQAARLLDGLLGDGLLGDGRLGDTAPTPGPPVLVLPGAGMPVKRWPDERWQSLVERLTGAGCQLVTVADAADLLPGASVLPPIDLRTLAALAAEVGRRGGAAVGGDTGPVRLATAAGCPAVGLYGPTLAARYGLSNQASQNLQGLPGCTVRLPTAITEQECWWSARCPLTGGGGPACMTDIAVDRVEAALRRLLAQQVPSPHAGVGRST
jgi:ADP-heptose:LPS heptosyltransferase